MLDNFKDVLTINEVANILRIGHNSVYKMLRSGEIPNKRVDSKYIIPKIGVISYLNACIKSA